MTKEIAPINQYDATIIGLLAIISLGWLIFTATVYPFVAGYTDHFEPTIASISWTATNFRLPIYHSLEAATRYSAVYGPLTFLINSVAFYVLGGTITASKTMGVLACLTSLPLIFYAARKHCDFKCALALTGITALGFLAFGSTCYMSRADAYLILCVAVATFAAARLPLHVAFIVLGVTAGVAINLKIHGILYIAPVALLLLSSRPSIRDIILSFLVALAVAISPFLLPNVSIINYITWLKATAAHGLRSHELIENLIFLIPMLTVLLSIVINRSNKRLEARDKIYLTSIFLAAILVTVVACKPGAGPHHYLPILPAIAYACALLLRPATVQKELVSSREGQQRVGIWLLMTAIVALIPQAILSQKGIADYLTDNWENRAATAQVKQVMALNPGRTIGMGYSQVNYSLTYVRPLLLFKGNPYLLDGGSLQDYDASNIKIPSATIKAISNCTTSMWLIPKGGEPFSKSNYYPTGRDIFSMEFRQAFLSSYKKTGETKLYDIWSCSRGAPATA